LNQLRRLNPIIPLIIAKLNDAFLIAVQRRDEFIKIPLGRVGITSGIVTRNLPERDVAIFFFKPFMVQRVSGYRAQIRLRIAIKINLFDPSDPEEQESVLKSVFVRLRQVVSETTVG